MFFYFLNKTGWLEGQTWSEILLCGEVGVTLPLFKEFLPHLSAIHWGIPNSCQFKEKKLPPQTSNLPWKLQFSQIYKIHQEQFSSLKQSKERAGLSLYGLVPCQSCPTQPDALIKNKKQSFQLKAWLNCTCLHTHLMRPLFWWSTERLFVCRWERQAIGLFPSRRTDLDDAAAPPDTL